jgi:Flp pilus assembly protein TadB
MGTLILLAAMMAGIAVAFIVLAFAKTNKPKASANDANFENLLKSEIEVADEATAIPSKKTWTGYWANLYIESGKVLTNVSLPSYWATGAGVVGFFFGVLVIPRNIIGGIGLAVGAILCLRALLVSQANKRVLKIENQLPNLLSGIRANLQANMTPEKALLSLADEFDGPIGEELRILRNDITVNIPLEEALQSMSDRVKSPELKFLVASIKLAVARGVDLDPQIGVIQKIVVQRASIASKLRIAIAQVTPAFALSVAIIPLGLLYSMTSSADNAKFWGSLLGIATMLGVAALYVIGILLTRQQINKVKKEQ